MVSKCRKLDEVVKGNRKVPRRGPLPTLNIINVFLFTSKTNFLETLRVDSRVKEGNGRVKSVF